MRRYTLHTLIIGVIALASFGHSGRSTGQMAQGPSTAKYPDFDTLVRGAKEYDGLFKLYHKDGQLLAELKPNQFEQPFLCPIAIARGMAQGGHTLNFDEQWVLVFRQVGDRVFLIRRNVRYQARASLPVAKAVETTYTDSVLMSLRVQSIHPIRGSVLLNFNDIFMSDFAQLRRGFFDASRSTWHKIKAFPRNIEIQVAATYSGGGRGGDSVIDGRGTTVVIHYGLCQLPEPGYTPRLADDRVGHFLSVVKDYSNDTKATPFTRYVNRWRLERADGSTWKEGGKLVPPKKKIIFWIEKSVPDEYRGFVRDGILEWNKAFAKVGFRDAIEVRQQENEEFDPEDSNYNTFRWITSDRGFAMGPSRANPLTGEIFDADIIFDASMVRYYRNDASVFGGSAAANDISPIRAQQKGMGLSALDMSGGNDEGGWDLRPDKKLDPFSQARAKAISNGMCECGPCLKRELNLLAMAVMLRDNAVGPPPSGGVLSEDLIGQAIKEVTMHEVGHTLGLRHNFKASTMLKNEDLHNTTITRARGLVGSVMDYAPVNLAPKGVKQGDYFTTTLGPYDYWVIEYAYRPLGGGTEGEVEELKKLASKCATPGLDYATDEDLATSSDPYVNTWDLGADPMKFAQDRILLAEELLGKLADKGADKGDGYQRTRQAFGTLLREYGNGSFLVSKFIGGVSMHRDHVGDPSGRDPLVVVAPDKQRSALKFVQDHILTDKPFHFSPSLLRRLATDRWMHWGTYDNMMASVEYPVHERVLAIQKVVLEHTLDSSTLSRIQNNSLRHDKDQKVKPFELSELFRGLTDGIWNEMGAEQKKIELSIVKRNLQREYLKNLIQMVLTGSSAPADARSLARLHLRDIVKRIDLVLGNPNMALDDTSRAHLQESKERITKALNAALHASES